MLREIQWVSRLANAVHPNTMQVRKHLSNRCGAVQVSAIIAPSGHHQICLTSEPAQPEIVARADRVSGGFQITGVSGSVSEKVGNAQAAKTPIPCKADTAADSWVIVCRIGGGGIQANQQ